MPLPSLLARALRSTTLALCLAGCAGPSPPRASGPSVDAGAPDPWLARPGVPAGRLDERTLDDPASGRARRVLIYTPPGYAREGAAYPVLYVFDGDDYAGELKLPVVLDNLLAEGRLPAFVAVLIDDSQDRLGDLANHAAFARFIGDVLVPWARAGWNVTHDPARTILGGYSAGGLAAVFVAFAHPQLFGNVLAQSGAFWRGNEGTAEPWEWLTSALAAADRLPLRFYLEVGDAETLPTIGRGPPILDANRRLRDVLRAKGYPLTYVEVPGAHHEPVHWRTQLPAALVALAAGWR